MGKKAGQRARPPSGQGNSFSHQTNQTQNSPNQAQAQALNQLPNQAQALNQPQARGGARAAPWGGQSMPWGSRQDALSQALNGGLPGGQPPNQIPPNQLSGGLPQPDAQLPNQAQDQAQNSSQRGWNPERQQRIAQWLQQRFGNTTPQGG